MEGIGSRLFKTAMIKEKKPIPEKSGNDENEYKT